MLFRSSSLNSITPDEEGHAAGQNPASLPSDLKTNLKLIKSGEITPELIIAAGEADIKAKANESFKKAESEEALSGKLKRITTKEGLKEIFVPSATYPKDFLFEATKRGMDIFGAAFLLTVVSPVMFLVYFAVRLSSPGEAVFSQRRLTEGGRVFYIYKFRTMVLNAEKASGPVYASSGDPRVTKLGKFLRVTRLDELPQLINVLIGDMSLVGPRPERPEMAVDLNKDLPSFHKRLEVKAGLTGFAQIEGGYASDLDSYRRKLALDLLYIKNRSILLDIKLCFQTVSVVFSGSGAR